jgi:putative hemolysin
MLTTQVFLQIALLLFLIIANGLFSMSELAVMTSRKMRLQQRAEDGDKGAETALALATAPNRFLSTVQIGITLVGTLSGAIGGATLARELGVALDRLLPALTNYNDDIALVLIVLIITYLSLVIGELVPKRLALADPERVAAIVAGPMNLLSRFAQPVVRLLSASTEVMLRLLRVKNSEEPSISEEEIRGLLQQGQQTGIFEQAETSIVASVFRLGDRRVDSLMTPRIEIDWLDPNDDPADNLRYMLESSHTLFPIAEDSLDNVVGILRAKDYLARLADGQPVDMRTLVQPALFVPESMPGFDLLEELRHANQKLALVIDEYGGMQGMVTLYDLMEAIVGAIPESGQSNEPPAFQREDGSWLLDGMLNIEEFKDLLDLDDLPGEDRAGYQTVGGFVLALLGEIPRAGMYFYSGGFRFEVLDMDGLRVDKVMAAKQEEEEE